MSGCIGFSHNTRPEYVMGPFSGTLVESRIIIWDIEDSRSIFSLGYYGKPLGIYKPKGIDFETPLILDLIEGCYLVESRLLTVNNVSGKQIILKEMKEICRNQYVDFDIKYLVFKKITRRRVHRFPRDQVWL